MSFELFMKTNCAIKSATVTVNVEDTGKVQLFFNCGTVHKYNLDKYKYCDFYYCKETQVVGLKPHNDYREYYYILTEKKGSVTVCATSLFAYYSIKLPVGKYKFDIFKAESNFMDFWFAPYEEV